MNISKEKFTELAKEHLLALESYKMDKNGNKPIKIYGIEELYKAINVIHCCKSDSELLKDKNAINFDLWCKIKNIHHSFDDFYLWDKTFIEKKRVLKMYQKFVQNL